MPVPLGRRNRLPAVLLAFGLAGTCGAQPTRPSLERTVDSLFAEYDGTPGVAIAVIRHGTPELLKGYGLANLEYRTPITPSTRFNIASVSKQFTAFAIHLLQRQGRLSLDDDIRRYIPELPDHGRPIRIRHLLAHTSGLRDQAALLAIAGWHAEDVVTTEQVIRLVSRQSSLNFPTGTAFGYSNTGYTLLAEAIARITGMRFAEYARRHIFEPLGMRRTVFLDDFHTVLDEHRAYSYERVGGSFVKREVHSSTPGASGLMTTGEDLARWVANFDRPLVGDARLIADFNRISQLDDGRPVIWSASPGDTTYHAKGQLHYTYKGQHVISHGGHDAAFRATLTRFPEAGLAVISLSNNEHYPMMGKVLPIVDLYLGERAVRPMAAASAPTAATRPDVAAPFDRAPADVVGEYRSEELMTAYRILVRNGTLVMTHLRLGDITLTPVATDRFSGTSTFPFTLRVLREGGVVTGFEISNFGAHNVRFDRQP
ncbi:MAG: beta-lactamase family protein [Gemmatimonadaceae bacterium]|nr:beta-lactamase family protein [Gemmatimonadaceae bacterium]